MKNHSQSSAQQIDTPLPPQPQQVSVSKKRVFTLFLPLLILFVLAGLLLRGLWLDPKKLPSALIGRSIPSFTLPTLSPEHAGVHPNITFNAQQMLGKPWVLNVFASWCAACVEEHPLWVQFAQNPQALNPSLTSLPSSIPVVGLAYKDKPDQSLTWLAQYGNPYATTTADMAGQYGIELGVYGVPETFIMDANNQVLYRHVGAVNAEFFNALAQLSKTQ